MILFSEAISKMPPNINFDQTILFISVYNTERQYYEEVNYTILAQENKQLQIEL